MSWCSTWAWRATSPRRSALLGRTPSRGSPRFGRTSTRTSEAGSVGQSLCPDGMHVQARPRPMRNACWSSSARRGASRRPHRRGATPNRREIDSNGAGSRSRPNSPSPTARSSEGDRRHRHARRRCSTSKSQHSKAKRVSRSGYRNHADSAFESSTPSSRQAAASWSGSETMLAFDSPSIGSICAPPTRSKHIRHRATPYRAIQGMPRTAALAMVFKLAQAAQNSWRRLDAQPVAQADRR